MTHAIIKGLPALYSYARAAVLTSGDVDTLTRRERSVADALGKHMSGSGALPWLSLNNEFRAAAWVQQVLYSVLYARGPNSDALAKQTIINALDMGTPVVCHCVNSHYRSPENVVALLEDTCDLSFEAALGIVMQHVHQKFVQEPNE